MLAEEVNVGESRLIRLRLDPGRQIPSWLRAAASRDRRGREVQLRPAPAGTHFDLEVFSEPPDTERAHVSEQYDLDWLGAEGRVALAWAAYTTDTEFGLECRSFVHADLGEHLAIGVGDAVAEQVRIAAEAAPSGFTPVRDWLSDEFALDPAPGETVPRFIHSGGVADDFSQGVNAFTLHGRRWVADVALVEGKFRITRMTDAATTNRGKWPRLSAIDLRFTDQGEEADATEAIRAALLGLGSDGRTYLNLWQAYNDIEREALVDEAKRLKWGFYHGCQILSDSVWRFELQPGERTDRFLGAVAARTGLELEAAGDLPAELTRQPSRPAASVHGKVRQVLKNNRTLDLAIDGDDPPPNTGYLHQSLSGDRVRLRRRDLARERIESDQAELPGLRLLIEGLPRPGAHPRTDPRYDRAVVAGLRTAPDAAEPTEVQLAALRLALRTPDILLVQGPPGTGKTRFIADLLRCLDEVGERAVATNRTLISSVQHDAVDNVASRARRLGLPPTRVSTKPERDQQSTRQWRDETAALLEEYLVEHRPNVAKIDRLVRLRQIAANYGQQPTTGADLTALLDEAKQLSRTELPGPVRARLDRALAHKRADERTRETLPQRKQDELARVIRSIRVTETAFADDGQVQAASAVRRLEPLLASAEKTTLERAASAGHADFELLAELTELRLVLLDRVGGRSVVSGTPGHDPEVGTLLHEIAEAVSEAFMDSPDSVDQVLRTYRDDLREDIGLVETTLARYNTVLASTVQQANSLEMNRILAAPLPVFDTVIVDEAARANPLDLMIPMALAQKRIILVGDHKQLPHALEQKVERELRRNRALDGSELSKSLFERWFDLFAGERPAVRTIRLDTQFRMHPVLGRFVSEVFYGAPDAIKAAPSTRSLTHNLASYTGKVAGWIDVPHDVAGGAQQDGFSWTREPEARRLAEELKKLAAEDTGRELTFGVITFYRAQQKLVENAIIDAGLGVPDDEGNFEPVPAMATTSGPRPRPRLRIGTVDAFQGMEFDVVLLSVTRSSPPPSSFADPAEAVQRYGHLLSDSRMCVAMSRQRRLLIAVGDAAMADRSSTPGAPGVPGRSVAEGIIAFRSLCEGVHGAGVRR
ncbi:DEAD/DEAH box helicase [Amycolatopsis sp. w19]|uniref:DEAD/DEAH box helicase n=1 Tax=Amycolatopsis sp. w19 TaxID=3448134 RepID=UPI003F1C06F3